MCHIFVWHFLVAWSQFAARPCGMYVRQRERERVRRQRVWTTFNISIFAFFPPGPPFSPLTFPHFAALSCLNGTCSRCCTRTFMHHLPLPGACVCVFHMWHVLRQAATALWFVWLAAKRNGRSCRQTTAKRQRKREWEGRGGGGGWTGKLHLALVSLSAQPQSMQHKIRYNIRQKICIFICVQPRGAWVTVHATCHKKYVIFSQFNSPIAKGDFRRRA